MDGPTDHLLTRPGGGLTNYKAISQRMGGGQGTAEREGGRGKTSFSFFYSWLRGDLDRWFWQGGGGIEKRREAALPA